MQEKNYNVTKTEEILSEKWARNNFFKRAEKEKKAEPFCIMMPPANVTGSLHIGHALTYTLQDIIVRFNRMCGRDVLWQPGVDHAGIATQMVVERQLEKKGIEKSSLSREDFLRHVWSWKEESGGLIVDQLKRLGASANWDRSRFTMDDRFNKAVNKCFITLFEKNLIYRDKRLVNWDVKLQTAISDLEVEVKEEKGTLWYIKYPLADDPTVFVIVATTRPETLFGDTAVAVHKDDERYKKLIGKCLQLPLTHKKIPIIADEHCDPGKGSGAVKITPAHDFNDFQVSKRHNLDIINILDSKACLNEEVPEAYRGLERFCARKEVLKELSELGLLEKEEEIIHGVPYGDRSGTVIEPWMTDQWFVNAKELSVAAIEAVENKKTKFIPEKWKAVYFEWLKNIEPWCISRQIWWGHQVPAWHGPDGKIFVGASEDEVRHQARKYYGSENFALNRDTDVLDTWFSSALWPFVTLGWPEKTEDLDFYYPTQVLITGSDLIFFWVARMMMMGLYFMKDVPFSKVYMHPLVLDEKGQKMSKSKGNVINPLQLIDEYGADALRCTISSLSAQGKNIRLSEKQIEGSRNFATKIWNTSRYLAMNGCEYDDSFNPCEVKVSVNRWIVYKLEKLVAKVTLAFQAYKFNESSYCLYQFIWGTFCDWYVEFSKPIINGSCQKQKEETKKCLAWCFMIILKLMHPIMPFITDKLAMQLLNIDITGDFSLSKEDWPSLEEKIEFKEAADDIDWVCNFVTEIRVLRMQSNIAPKVMLTANILEASDSHKSRVNRCRDLILTLAKVEKINFVEKLPPGCIQLIQDGITVGIPMQGVIDVDKERQRLIGTMEKLEVELNSLKKKLDNEEFMKKAPQSIIEEQHRRQDMAMAKLSSTRHALERLESI